MRFRQRDDERPPRPAGEDGAQGDGLESVRAEGDELLSAADEAIRRALSGDSERFLRQARQQGGQ